MRLITDIFAYCQEHLPRWNTISISGYHIREAGATAVQEVAFTLGNAIAYVEAALQAGLEVDEFAPRLSFFFNAHNNLFEEVAKFRAARRIWARIMKRALWRAERALAAAALSHPDRRLDAHRPAAREQCRARDPPSPGRRAGRHAEPAHQLARRSPLAAHRRVGPDRPAHPADHRPRERRGRHRSTRWPAATMSNPSPTRSNAGRWNTWTRSTRWAACPPRSSRASCSARSKTAPTPTRRRRERETQTVVGVNQFDVEQEQHARHAARRSRRRRGAKGKAGRPAQPARRGTRAADAWTPCTPPPKATPT